jgi:hypothetical protein
LGVRFLSVSSSLAEGECDGLEDGACVVTFDKRSV